MPAVQRLLAACVLASALCCAAALAQETRPAAASAGAPGDAAAAHEMPQDLEPGVNTSAPSNEGPAQKPRPKALPAASAKPAAQAPAPVAGGPKGSAKDRIELDTTQITGNRELPKVLYIVPWKRSDLSDLAGRPANSLLDEVLMPVDRDVFKRENRYYGALQPDEPLSGGRAVATPAPAAEPRAAQAPPARDEK